MLFNSYIFLFLFLPICLLGYFTLNHFKKYKLAQAFLLIMSLWFYAYFNIYYLLIIILSIIINYLIYHIFKITEKKNSRKLLLYIGLLFNIGILIYYKYMDFFIDNINKLFNCNFNLLNIVLPLGISFFTFQQLSFVIDAYKKEVPNYSFLYYASFVAFFPQLIAGPIVTYDELIPQFLNQKNKSINWDNLAKGIYIFTLGLAKKVLIADVFGIAVNWGYSNIDTLNTTNSIIIMLSYTIQIYFDFSGYSDMAIGLGKMFNIDLPTNFNSPYKALNINDFWDRWHMTLTRFFTKYIYIPLGGSKKGVKRTYINILIIFIISGFWHGANWTFVFWGLLHGIFSVVTRKYKNFFDKLHPVLNWMITFGFVNIAWIFFRADSIKQALRIIYRILLCNFGPINENIINAFELPELNLIFKTLKIDLYFPYAIPLLFFIITFIIMLGSLNTIEKAKKFKSTPINIIKVVILLVWSIISFSGISTFLYFNF